MLLDDIVVGETDLFNFDFSVLFPSGIDPAHVVLSTTPSSGWVFATPAVSGSKVNVYGTAPTTPGSYILTCTATDDTPRTLTVSQSINVIAHRTSKT